MPSNARLVKAAMTLRGEAPQAWAEFVEAMHEYAEQAAVDMVRCAPDMLVRVQGMALQASEIANVLKNAPQLSEKTGKRNG